MQTITAALMPHLMIAPIRVPLITACLMLFLREGKHRTKAQQQGQNRDIGRRLGPLVKAHHVAAGDVAKFVREHALDLVGGPRFVDQAGVDIDSLPACHKSVDRFVIDQHELDIAGLQLAGLDQRGGHVLEQFLGLGIAQDRLRGDRLDCNNRARQQGEAMASDPAVLALCEKSLTEFLYGFLTKQPGVKQVPRIRVVYKPSA